MEGYGTDLESETDKQQSGPYKEQGLGLECRDVLCNDENVGRSRHAINQCDAVQEESRGESAEEEILQ